MTQDQAAYLEACANFQAARSALILAYNALSPEDRARAMWPPNPRPVNFPEKKDAPVG